MNLFLVELAIENPLNGCFGWLTRILLDFFGNYGLAIIMLTVIIRGALVPLNINSQKAALKSQALASKQADIKRKYPDDKNKQQEELTKLMSENGANGLGAGCLLPLLQIVFLLPLYRVVSAPLRYLSNVSVSNIKKMAELAGLTAKSVATNNIPLIQKLTSDNEFFIKCVNKGYISAGQLIDLHFCGIDLARTPSFSPFTIMKEPSTYVPLVFVPILVLILNVISMKLTQVLKAGYKEEREAKKRARMNPAIAGQIEENSTELMMKTMTWVMPVVMLITTFMMPAAMGLYWIIGGLMGIITQLLVYVLFTKPYELKKAELQIKKENYFKKSASESKTDSSVSAKNKKNNKSKKK